MPPEESVQRAQRKPKCSRCRNHGFVVKLKGHSGGCPFVRCRCWKCSLITQRTSITARHRRMKKAHGEECVAGDPREMQSRAPASDPDAGDGPAASPGAPGGTQGEAEVRRKPQTDSAAAGREAGLGAFGDSDATGREIPRWRPANPRFPVDSASAEVFQREKYPGDLMTAAVPGKPLGCYPDSCPILTLLLNPSLGWSRGLGDLDLRFPQFQPSAVPNSIYTGPSRVRPVPLFTCPTRCPGGDEPETLSWPCAPRGRGQEDK